MKSNKVLRVQQIKKGHSNFQLRYGKLTTELLVASPHYIYTCVCWWLVLLTSDNTVIENGSWVWVLSYYFIQDHWWWSINTQKLIFISLSISLLTFYRSIFLFIFRCERCSNILDTTSFTTCECDNRLARTIKGYCFERDKLPNDNDVSTQILLTVSLQSCVLFLMFVK